MMSFFKTLEHSLWKATRKRDKRLKKAREDRHKRLQVSLAKDAINRAIFARDRGRCRVCDIPVLLFTSDDFARMQPHHIIYASAQGSDELPNRCALCLKCHALEHGHRISIEGNGNETLTVTFFAADLRTVVDVKDSPCPR